MRYFLTAIFLLVLFVSNAQLSEHYVAARNGLSIREKADLNGKVLDKIPYGTKVTLGDFEGNMPLVTTEGMKGNWRRVNFNGKSGFILDTYLFPYPPPKAGTKDLKEWFLQLGAAHGNLLTVKTGKEDDDSFGWSIMKKQLFKNGCEWHEYTGHEYYAENYFIPGMIISQGFLLIRLLKTYPKLISESDPFPTKNSKVSKENTDKMIFVERDDPADNNSWIRRVRIEFLEGGNYIIELFMVDNQLVIAYSTGV